VYQRAIELLALAYEIVVSSARYERRIHLLEGVVAMLTKMV